MIRKKICMLGGFAVGKTSLVVRFVQSLFAAKYQTTVGVKIDKKVVEVGEQELDLILWDLHGEDDFQKVRTSYLRGTAGYLLVADGTRATTLDTAVLLQQRTEEICGRVPFILLLNKADLAAEWAIGEEVRSDLEARGWTVLETSAKTGKGVEEAFLQLATRLLEE
jgi:small GTP-binding protein